MKGVPYAYESRFYVGLVHELPVGQIEPKAEIAEETVGLCIDENLQPYRMSITGIGGCNRFMKGQPARAEGSSRQPPTAKPTR